MQKNYSDITKLKLGTAKLFTKCVRDQFLKGF